MKIYLTSAGAVGHVKRGKAKQKTAATVGPGLAYSIMRMPRPEYGELLNGRVLAFTPPLRLFEAARAGRDGDDPDGAWAVYEQALTLLWTAPRHAVRTAPGALRSAKSGGRYDPDAKNWDGEAWSPGPPVADGDTLCCSCGAETAKRGRCHRVIAARILRGVGWDVVLDGVDIR